jgi:hypothetical protein
MDAGPTATLIQERLEQLDTITVDRSSHPSFDDGHCSMEIVAWLAGEAHTAAPRCASPVIRAFTIGLNDQGGSEQRQKLRPYLPRMVGTIADGQDEARSYLALDWLIRTFTPAWLDLAGLSVEAKALRDLRRIVDLAAAGAAGPVARDAREKATDARAAVGAAARNAAAWAAVGGAAWDAAWGAAWNAAEAAWADAAGDIVGDTVGDALKPTVEALHQSALELLDRMVDLAAAEA